MDFELKFSPEIEAFRKDVSDWMDVHAPKVIQSSNPRDYHQEYWDGIDNFRQELGGKGWLYPTSNPTYGGGGLTVEHAVIISQELDKRHIGGLQDLGARTAAFGMQVFGTEEQKNHWIPTFMKGEADGWQLLTEPQGGSDLASARTTAILDGDDYVVNGQKIFVGNEHVAKYGTAIVNSDPTGARHRNLSYLIIPLDSPGITIQPLYLLSGSGRGERPSLHKNIVFFDDVRVPVFNRIGNHNQGWDVAGINMEMEHGGSGNIGDDRTFNRLIGALRDIELNGKPLLEDTEVRELLGELNQERQTLRLFGLRNYYMSQTKARMAHEGPQLSFWTKSRSHAFAHKIQDMLGNFTLVRDPKYAAAQGYLELWQRACFVEVHYGGGLNIQATVMARRLGLGRNTKEEAARME
jgi:alkylation response protein AidB-like acyl-CoA dehydrogenase